MLYPVIDWEICESCYPCEARRSCKTRAIIKIDQDEPPYIELSRCTRCGDCVLSCLYSAISMKNGIISGGIPKL